MRFRVSNFCSVAVCMATTMMSQAVLAQASVCGDPFAKTLNGPYDYRTAPAENKRVVEVRHFNADVRSLRKGSTTKNLAADIAFTLRVFPNHHQALIAMGDYAIKTKQNPPAGAQYTVECWYDRALRFTPDDPLVKTVYGMYLIKVSKQDEAIKQLEAARAQAANDSNVHYNLGLAYLNLKRYDEALQSAHAAYRLGFPLPGLKNRLQRAGKWREAVD